MAAAWRLWRQTLAGCAVQLRRVPGRLKIIALLALGTLAILLSLHKASPVRTANLHVQVQHGLRSAQLKIWVDDRLAYQGRITGSMRKRFGLIPGAVQGSFAHAVQVASGKHTVRMQVSAGGEGYDEASTLEGQFPAGAEVNLLATAHRHDLTLEWQGTSMAAAESDPPWYVKSLLMTMVGSIFSALMAFVIRELPNLARRGGETISKA
jgi:hypothetical protein